MNVPKIGELFHHVNYGEDIFIRVTPIPSLSRSKLISDIVKQGDRRFFCVNMSTGFLTVCGPSQVFKEKTKVAEYPFLSCLSEEKPLALPKDLLEIIKHVSELSNDLLKNSNKDCIFVHLSQKEIVVRYFGQPEDRFIKNLSNAWALSCFSKTKSSDALEPVTQAFTKLVNKN